MTGMGLLTLKRAAFLGLVMGVMGFSPAQSASANYVVNGSFENQQLPYGSYGTFTSIPGWTTSFGPGIEVQNHVAGTPYDGNQYVELDSTANSGMYQDLATKAGQTYQLSFAYSPRPGIAASSTEIDVLWGGSLVTGIALSGVGMSDTQWKVYTFNLVATSSTTRLEFDANGMSDTVGGYLDAVSVSVPEPSSLAMCGIAGLIGVGTARRRRNRLA